VRHHDASASRTGHSGTSSPEHCAAVAAIDEVEQAADLLGGEAKLTGSLEKLREGLGISQEEPANVMEVQQPAISKLVRHPVTKVSTLRDLIAAMGGELYITATFPDRSVELGNFTAEPA